jgi:hypothetical protein
MQQAATSAPLQRTIVGLANHLAQFLQHASKNQTFHYQVAAITG